MRSFSVTPLLLLFSAGSTAAMRRDLRAVIRGTEGNEEIFGLAQITERGGSVEVKMEVKALPDGPHGVHFHTYGDEVGATDGTAAGGHYNPNEVDHAGPSQSIRHVADLGNIISDGGKASYSRTFSGSDPSRPTIVSDFMNSVIGRGIIIHRDVDDLVSQPTGNAGPRLAIGVVGIGNQELVPGALEVKEHTKSRKFVPPHALVCKIRGDGISGVGMARLCNGVLEFGANVTGLAQGPQGMHIHWYGDEYEFVSHPMESARNLSRAGGHYNPTGDMHALPGTRPRHYGDTGNIVTDASGEGILLTTVPDVPDLRYWVGRTCLIHEGTDDGGQPAGNSGARIAAGQLGFANPDTIIEVEGATPAEECQPINSEEALCRYIHKISKLMRVYKRFISKLPNTGLVKISTAVRLAEEGNVLGSMDRVRATVRATEGVDGDIAEGIAKVGARQARNLAQKMIGMVVGVIDKATIDMAKRQIQRANALFGKKKYSEAATWYRKVVRTIVFSDYFPSRMLNPPNCS